MKEEVTRILKLVSEGKLSPEDAAELIDAFGGAESAQTSQAAEPPKEPGAARDPFKVFVEAMEGFGRDVQNVNWQEVTAQVRQGAQKGVEAIKKAADDLKAGNISLFGVQEVREFTLPLQIAEGQSLQIENPGGSVTVLGGQSDNQVMVKARVRGATTEEAKKRADEFSVVVEESDHVVQIKQPRVASVSVDLVVYLTVGCPVDVKTEAGELTVENTGSSAKVNCQAGDVRLAGLRGLIDATLQTGDLTVEACDSPAMNLESRSGDISLRKVMGSVNARLASGDIAIADWSGKTLSVESVSGDVRADLSQPPTGNISIRTVNGDAHLSVVDGGDCRVSLSTLRGSVSCSVPLEDEARADHRVTGRLGSGSGTLDVSGINGSITLKLADSAAPPAEEAATETPEAE